jgi:tetratricopeptide (TPR) repeat protein
VRTVGGQTRAGAFVAPFQYEHFVRAELALAAGDLPGAIEGYRMARAGGDDDPLLAARLADALDRAGDRSGADAAIAEGLALDASSEPVWMARGAIAERRGERETALQAYGRAARAAPDSAAPVHASAALLDAMGATGRARALREAYATRVGPQTPVRASVLRAEAAALLADGRPSAALRRLGARTGDDGALLRVRALLALGRRDEAEGLLSTSSADAFGGSLAVANLLVAAGRADRAVEIAEADATAGPEASVALGGALLAAGRTGEATVALANVAPGTSVHDEARHLLADALAAEGLPALAREVAPQ